VRTDYFSNRKDIVNILHQLTRTQIDRLVNLCSRHLTLTGDVSNYARGRQRSWLRHEAPLSDARPWRSANQNDELWNEILEICNQISFVPELGLASLGGEISAHRDASYADWRAIGINLGVTTFGYELSYPEFRWAPPSELVSPPQVSLTRLVGGEVFEFNCKNRHWTSNVSADRWSINLWRVSPKRRHKFNEFLQNSL